MQNESRLRKIIDSFRAKVILPIAGLILLSGCYSVIHIEKAEVKRTPHVYLRDSDRDGIPDIYDARPYHYDFPRKYGPHHPYHIYPWYQFHPEVKKYIKPEVKQKERTKDTRKLRNNSGERGSGKKGRR